MGTVVVSADAELGWGFHDLDSPPRRRVRSARDGWRTLLSLSEQYDLPLTWAVVGHLMLEECDGRHDDLPTVSGWFDHERGPDAWPRAFRFGPDLVEAVRSSPVDHEIGCHTFSHVEFGDPETDERLARAELRAFDRVADERGITPRSFVFPRNAVGHRDVLAAFDYECYRAPSRFSAPDSTSGRLVRTLSKTTIVREPVPLVDPTVDDYGLVNVPASMFLFDVTGIARSVGEPIVGDPVVTRAKRGIDAAAAGDGVFHLWLHPNNLVGDRDATRVEAVFRYVDEVRRSTALAVEPMGTVAARVRSESAVDGSPTSGR